MPLEYAVDGTTYVGAPPPQAKGWGVNTYLACAAAGMVVVGALSGLGDLFGGHHDVVNHANAGLADQFKGLQENKGLLGNAWANAHEAAGDTAKAAGSAIKDGTNHVIEGATEFGQNWFDPSNSELKKVVSSLYANGTDVFSQAKLEEMPNVQAFLSSGKSGIIDLPNGDILLRDHGVNFQLDDARIKALSPHILEKYPLLQGIHEAKFGKPIDLQNVASTLGFGAAAGLGTAALADNAQKQTQSSNPYMQAQSTLQTNHSVAYQDRVSPTQLRTAAY